MATDPEMLEQERQSAVRLTSAEHERVRGGDSLGTESVYGELAIHRESSMGLFELRELDPHHPASDNATPASRTSLLRADACVPNRFLGCAEGEAVIPIGKLEEFAVLDGGSWIEPLYLGSDPGWKAAGVKGLDRSDSRATSEEGFPHGPGIVADRSHGPQPGDCYPHSCPRHDSPRTPVSTRTVDTR